MLGLLLEAMHFGNQFGHLPLVFVVVDLLLKLHDLLFHLLELQFDLLHVQDIRLHKLILLCL